jgi:hypothetical protein
MKSGGYFVLGIYMKLEITLVSNGRQSAENAINTSA